jgi:hypothetical protein
VEVGQDLDQKRSRFQQRGLVLFGGKRAETNGNVSLFRESETCPDVGRRQGSETGEVYGRGDEGKALGVEAVSSERVPHGSRNGNHPLGAGPEQLAADRKGHPAGRDERGSPQRRADPGEGERVCVVRMKNGSTTTDLAEDGRKHARIEAGSPANRAHTYTLGPQPAGKFGFSPGDDDLIDAEPAKLTGQ